MNALHGADERFLVVKGEELSDTVGGKPLHVNGLDVSDTVAAPQGSSVADVVERSVDAIRAKGGVPHVNHPNFGWAIAGDDLAAVERFRLLEIFNGHPQVNNLAAAACRGWNRSGIESNGRAAWTQPIVVGR